MPNTLAAPESHPVFASSPEIQRNSQGTTAPNSTKTAATTKEHLSNRVLQPLKKAAICLFEPIEEVERAYHLVMIMSVV